MFWLNLVILLLIISLWIGVCYTVIEFLKQLIDKKFMEKKFDKLQTQFNEYQRMNSERLQNFQKSYESLYQRYTDYQNEVNKLLVANDSDLESVFRYADRIIQMNQNFFEKIKLISLLLSQEKPNKEEIKQLEIQLSNDIKMQRDFRQKQEELYQERKAEIERKRNNGLYEEPDLGDDYER